MKIHVEVYLASRMLGREKGSFEPVELIERIRTEFGDTRPGIRTHVTAHCVANAKKNAGTVHNYLWRIDHGCYRSFDAARDTPHASRADAAQQPNLDDVPQKYNYLLGTHPVSPASGRPAHSKRTAPRLSAQAFEELARKVLSHKLGMPLRPGQVPGVPKLFDFVSPNGRAVGDAKYYALLRGKQNPPAKFSAIAEHVWLLEKTGASTTFLVFGNDRQVPVRWLKRYRDLMQNVTFYFLTDAGELEVLS